MGSCSAGQDNPVCVVMAKNYSKGAEILLLGLFGGKEPELMHAGNFS